MPEQGSIILHFEGDIVDNHHVSARTLGKSLTQSQKAIDRAYLDLKYGNLWKYARLRNEDYLPTEFIADYPQEGGLVQAIRSMYGQEIVDRIQSAMRPAYEALMNSGLDEANYLEEDARHIRHRIETGDATAQTYEQLVENPDPKVTRRYGDRSINREIDQMLTLIRNDSAGASQVTITTNGSARSDFVFDREKSVRFHHIVSKRQLGSPVIFSAAVLKLARDNLTGVCRNISSGHSFNLNFITETDFLEVHPYLAGEEQFTFIGSPIIEYSAFDPNSGDVYYLKMA